MLNNRDDSDEKRPNGSTGEAVDLVPLRLPLILGGLAVGAFASARGSRKNADHIRQVAATATEGVLHQVNIVKNRVNGVVSGIRSVNCVGT